MPASVMFPRVKIYCTLDQEIESRLFDCHLAGMLSIDHGQSK